MKKVFYTILIAIITININGCSNNNIATVNGIGISKDEYEKTINLIEATSNYTNYNLEDREKLENVIKDYLIDNEIVYQKAKEQNLIPTDDEIKIRYEELKTSIASNERYKKYLENMNIDEEFLYKLIKKDIAIEKYKNNFQDTINISDKELKDYYNHNKNKFKVEEINASQILISTLDKDNKLIKENRELKDKAYQILEKINKGESFEELANKYSDDKFSGRNGGDLGYFTKYDKNIEFTSVVFQLDVNAISDVFETSYGYHIVKLKDKREYIKEFDECKEEVKKYILNEKYINHIQELNKNSKIKL